jgi:hypothetical protein
MVVLGDARLTDSACSILPFHGSVEPLATGESQELALRAYPHRAIGAASTGRPEEVVW